MSNRLSHEFSFFIHALFDYNSSYCMKVSEDMHSVSTCVVVKIINSVQNKTKGTLVHERERLTSLLVCFEYT